LSRDHASTPCNPYLSTILLSVAEHLVDSDTASIINIMFERGDLSPIAHDWLANWSSILSLPEISSVARPLTRTALLDALQAVSATVRDVPMHRQPLVDLVMDFCVRQDYRKGERDGYEVVWNILADELVLRTIEAQEKEDKNAEDTDKVLEETLTTPMLDLLKTTAADGDDGEGDLTLTVAAPAQTYTTAVGTMSSNVSPVLARGQFDYPGAQRDRAEPSAIPGVMSLISSLATGGGASGAAVAARSQVQAPPRADDSSSVNIPLSAPDPPGMPAALGAVVALVHIFAQLACASSASSSDSYPPPNPPEPASQSCSSSSGSGSTATTGYIRFAAGTTGWAASPRLAVLLAESGWRISRQVVAAVAVVVGTSSRRYTRNLPSILRKSSGPAHVPQSVMGATHPAGAMGGPLVRRLVGAARESPTAS
jgi:hypothetical protein